MTSWSRLALSVSTLLLAAAASAAAQVHHATMDDVHRTHADPRAYIASLDRPEREAWQKPHEVISALQLSPGDVVADIGAGSGYFALRFAHHVGPTGKVLAVDVSQPMLDELTTRARAASLRNVVPLLTPPDDPRLPDGGVQLVFSCDSWHHIDQRAAYLTKIKRALAPGGRLVIVDFHKDAPMGPPPAMKRTRADVLAEVEAAGFRLAAEHTFLPHQYFLVFTPAP